MDINLPETKAAVETAFARYEAALMTNDVETLQTLFWNSPHTLRYGIAEILHGCNDSDSDAAFRRPDSAGYRSLHRGDLQRRS